MQTVALTPLFRHSVGFDRFNDLFESAFGNNAGAEATSYPPYNIAKLGENQYCITMAVAGFKPEELDVVVHDGELMISGKVQRDDSDLSYLHKGIATRAFQRKFSLADYMEVKGADIADGLLHIQLERVVPESAKPRAITINSSPALEANALEDQSKKSKKKS